MKKIVKYTAIITGISFVVTATLFQFVDVEKLTNFKFSVNGGKGNFEDYVDYEFNQKLNFVGADEILVRTVSGDVQIKKSPDDQLHFIIKGKVDKNIESVKSDKFIHQKDQRVEVALDKIFENNEALNGFFKFDGGNLTFIKGLDMVIEIPQQYKKLIIETTSGDYKVRDLVLENMQIHSISGNIEIDQLTTNQLSMTGVSSDFQLHNPAFKNISVETVSGDVEISLPESSEFLAEINSISGELEGNHFFRKYIQGDTLKIGNSDKKISIKTVSGDVEFKTKNLE